MKLANPYPWYGTSLPRSLRTVATINPADIEVGVDLTGTVTWFRTDEVVAL